MFFPSPKRQYDLKVVEWNICKRKDWSPPVRGECRQVELCSRKFSLNYNQTNLESQVKSVRFLLNKPIKWVNRRVKNKSKKTYQVHEESLTIKDGVDELEQEGDGDYVTKEYVYEMMKMQESLFRNLFDSLLTNVNSRIDGVIKDLAELKSSLQFTQKDVEDLKPVTKQMTKIGKELGEV